MSCRSCREKKNHNNVIKVNCGNRFIFGLAPPPVHCCRRRRRRRRDVDLFQKRRRHESTTQKRLSDIFYNIMQLSVHNCNYLLLSLIKERNCPSGSDFP